MRLDSICACGSRFRKKIKDEKDRINIKDIHKVVSFSLNAVPNYGD